MKVTITGASGLGTSKATITVAHLRADAVNECTAFNASRTDCVEAVLNTPLAAAISANCETGEFTSLYGQSLVYAGEEQIRDAQSGEALAAAQASGYYAALEQFSALCPNRVAQ